MKTTNCPINEQTADGVSCGRCWFHLVNDVCPRHGNVRLERIIFDQTGKTTLENDMRKRKGLQLLGSSPALGDEEKEEEFSSRDEGRRRPVCNHCGGSGIMLPHTGNSAPCPMGCSYPGEDPHCPVHHPEAWLHYDEMVTERGCTCDLPLRDKNGDIYSPEDGIDVSEDDGGKVG